MNDLEYTCIFNTEILLVFINKSLIIFLMFLFFNEKDNRNVFYCLRKTQS